MRQVKEFRLASRKAPTRVKANEPGLFTEIRQPTQDYLLFPRHSSEGRAYIPFAFLDKDFIVHDSCTSLPGANHYHFGILTSAMHMAWVRQIAGRLKSDYRYSNTLVYNTFPWPEPVPAEQKQKIERLAQSVLDARAAHPTSTLADLYGPVSMPADLHHAHRKLDAAVDRAYRVKPFRSEAERLEHLFAMYARLLAAEQQLADDTEP